MATRKPGTVSSQAARAPSTAATTLRVSAARKPAAARVDENEIYRRIHAAVLDQRLQPGTKLKEVALAEVFGANRSVVRKVLARLAHNRLVVLRPNRGAVVASPSVGESRDLFAARRAIEAAIVDAVTRKIAPSDVKALRALAASERDAYYRGELRKALKLSLKFHQQLAAIAGNGVLAEFLDQLIARTPLVVLAYRGRGTDPACSIDEHSQIVDAIMAGDIAKAVAAMTAHLQSLEDQLDLNDVESPTDLGTLFGVDED
ncbi:MAG: GntR family transcriptional regulator [Pseudomonadota bacterium]|nr:GntR family transcriptional regulator [Pseudomonadota bacterium]